MAFTIIKTLCTLAVFASAVQGDAIAKREENTPLAKRQGACDPGETLCGTVGTLSYCAREGQKCCSLLYVAPDNAICCDAGTYARPGYYCCSGGGSCPVGETCLACTPDKGNSPTSAVAPSPSSSALTTPPPEVTSTITRTSYTYYTFTITYYYYQLYWIYVPTLTRSTSTSSEVTTTYITSVYASNSAEAQLSVDDITATASFPTPESATELPPLETSSADESSTSRPPPVETSSADDESSTSRRRPSATEPLESVSSAASASASSSVAEFTGGAGGQGRVGATLYSSLGAWLVTLGVATGVLCALL